MSDDRARRAAEQAARDVREGEFVFAQIKELEDGPIVGRFDVEHLKAVHSYLFQDLPHHRPGVIREDTERWVKARMLDGTPWTRRVHYAHESTEARIRPLFSARVGMNRR